MSSQEFQENNVQLSNWSKFKLLKLRYQLAIGLIIGGWLLRLIGIIIFQFNQNLSVIMTSLGGLSLFIGLIIAGALILDNILNNPKYRVKSENKVST